MGLTRGRTTEADGGESKLVNGPVCMEALFLRPVDGEPRACRFSNQSNVRISCGDSREPHPRSVVGSVVPRLRTAPVVDTDLFFNQSREGWDNRHAGESWSGCENAGVFLAQCVGGADRILVDIV